MKISYLLCLDRFQLMKLLLWWGLEAIRIDYCYSDRFPREFSCITSWCCQKRWCWMRAGYNCFRVVFTERVNREGQKRKGVQWGLSGKEKWASGGEPEEDPSLRPSFYSGQLGSYINGVRLFFSSNSNATVTVNHRWIRTGNVRKKLDMNGLVSVSSSSLLLSSLLHLRYRKILYSFVISNLFDWKPVSTPLGIHGENFFASGKQKLGSEKKDSDFYSEYWRQKWITNEGTDGIEWS